MAHIAGLVAAGLHPSPVPHADFVTHDHAQDAARSARRLVLCKAEHAKALDRAVFPGIQGGPLMHVIAAKAVCFREALEPAFTTLSAADRGERAARSPRRSREPGFRLVSGGTDNHLMLVDVRAEGLHRQGGRGRARHTPASPSTRT